MREYGGTEDWERGLVPEVADLSDVDWRALDTPYVKPMTQIDPGLDMIRWPDDMIQITINKSRKPLSDSQITHCWRVITWLKILHFQGAISIDSACHHQH